MLAPVHAPHRKRGFILVVLIFIVADEASCVCVFDDRARLTLAP